MNSKSPQVLTCLTAGAILALMLKPACGANELIEYEGKLSLNTSEGPDVTQPLVRVVTQNDIVQKIILRDHHQHPERVEVFSFTGNKLTRYQITSGKPGEAEASYDLITDKSFSRPERERAIARAEMLLKHYYWKGRYRKLPSNASQ